MNQTAINPKNVKTVNKCINALTKYYALNDLRDAADNRGDEKEHRKLDTKCSNAFDKYLDLLSMLPKYEQKIIEKL